MVVQLKQGVIFNNLGLWTPMLGHYRYMVSAWPQPKKTYFRCVSARPSSHPLKSKEGPFLVLGMTVRFRHKNPTIPAVFCHGAIPVIPVVDENIKASSFLGSLGSDPPHWWPPKDAGYENTHPGWNSEFFAPPIWTKIVERKSSSVKKWEWLHLPPKFSGVKMKNNFELPPPSVGVWGSQPKLFIYHCCYYWWRRSNTLEDTINWWGKKKMAPLGVLLERIFFDKKNRWKLEEMDGVKPCGGMFPLISWRIFWVFFPVKTYLVRIVARCQTKINLPKNEGKKLSKKTSAKTFGPKNPSEKKKKLQ